MTLPLIADNPLRLETRIDRLKERLWDRIKDRQAPPLSEEDRRHRTAGAMMLYCEIGDVTHFGSADQRTEKSISKQGTRRIRSLLYGCVISTLRDGTSPPARTLFDRLKDKRKHRETLRSHVCSGLLAIVYGCWSKGERFDPTFEMRLKARQKEKSGSTEQIDDRPVQEEDLTAPISRREAKRRRKATSPQKSGSSS